MRIKKKYGFLTAIVIIIIFSFGAYYKYKKSKQVQSGQLKNGLNYYLVNQQNKTGESFVTLSVNAGSLDEEKGIRGIAHLIEHLSFRGTKHYPDNQIDYYFSKTGVRYDAHTGYKSTNYQIIFSSKKKEIMEKSFDILSDISINTSFNTKNIRLEKNIVLQELRGRRDTELESAIKNSYSKGTTFQKFKPIGVENEIKNIKSEQLKKFYRTYYQPKNISIVVVGDFDKKEIERLIRKKFGRLKNNNIKIPERGKKKDLKLDENLYTYRDPNSEKSGFYYTVIIPYVNKSFTDKADEVNYRATNTELLEGLLKLKNIEVSSNSQTLIGSQKRVTYHLILDENNNKRIITDFFRGLKRLAAYDIPFKVLKEVQSTFDNFQERYSDFKRNRVITDIIIYDFLEVGLVPSIEKIVTPKYEDVLVKHLKDSAENMTERDIKEMAKQIYETPNNSGLLVNSKELKAKDIKKIIEDVKKEKLESFSDSDFYLTDRAEINLPVDLKPGKIIESKIIDGIHSYILDNGIKVLFKKNTSGGLTGFSYYNPRGKLDSKKEIKEYKLDNVSRSFFSYTDYTTSIDFEDIGENLEGSLKEFNRFFFRRDNEQELNNIFLPIQGKSILFVTGDLQEDEVKEGIKKYTATIKTQADIKREKIKLMEKKEIIQENDANSEDLTRLTFKYPYLNTEYSNDKRLMFHALTSLVREIIFKELRDERGLVYSPKIKGGLSRSNPHTNFLQIDLEVKKGTEKEVKKLVGKALEEILYKNYSDDILKGIVERYNKNLQNPSTSNLYIGSGLIRKEYLSKDYGEIPIEKYIKLVTKQNISMFIKEFDM